MSLSFKFQKFKLLQGLILIWLASFAFDFPYQLNLYRQIKVVNSFSLVNLYFSDVATLLWLVASGLIILWHKKLALALKIFIRDNQKFLTILLLFSLLPSLSALWSGSPLVSFFEGARVFSIILAMVGAVFFLQRSQKLKFWFYRVLIWLGTIESIIAISQFLKRASLGLYFLGESHLEATVTGLPRIMIGGERWLRAFGTFPHPNVLGGFLLLTLSPTLIMYFSDQRIKKNFYFLLIFIQLIGLTLTFSRSAFLGLFVVLAFFIWKNRRKIKLLKSERIPERKNFSKIIKITFLVVIVLSGLLLATRWSSIESMAFGRDESSRLRFELAKASLERFHSAPLLGRGFLTDTVELPAFSNYSFYLWEYQPVHNIFLLVLADLGLVGFILFLIFVLKAGKKLQKLEKQNSIWGGLFLAYLLIGLFDHYFLTLPQGLFIFFLVALIWLAVDKKREKEQ